MKYFLKNPCFLELLVKKQLKHYLTIKLKTNVPRSTSKFSEGVNLALKAAFSHLSIKSKSVIVEP